jgi:cytochrome P450/ferredoxin-NADP reductase
MSNPIPFTQTGPSATAAVSPTGCPISQHAAAFDPFEGPYHLDPADELKWSRENEPVFYSPKLGYWVVTRYEDVKAVFRDNILFSPSIALERITPPPPEAEAILKHYGYAMDRTMVNEDEPAHMARRRVLLESFAPEALEKHKPAVRRLARDYMDRFIDNGKADLVDEMFWEIPLTIALHFLGVGEDDISELRQFCIAHTINIWGRPTREEQLSVADQVGRFWQAANRTLDKMMADPSGDGWMHFTIRQHLKYPDAVPESYMRSMMMAILAAAHETTSNASANAFRLLLSNREAWTEICDNPELIPNAVEECLRRSGSIIAWRRITTADARVGNVDIPKGAKLLIVMASANHDQRHFENPDVIDLYRDNTAEHLSFGYGSHQCMGKNIARMELRIFIEEFAKRLPHMELVPDQEFTYLPNISFRGPSHLWVRWDPKQNPERRDPTILDRNLDFKIGAPARNSIARHMRVADVTRAADGIVRLVLEDPKGRTLPQWSPGSHIDVVTGGYDRKYSLCGDPNDAKRFEVAILREDDGRGGSRHIHEHVRIGTMLRVRGPKNHFRLDETAARYVLVAGGIGITPIIAMADRLKHLGKSYAIHYAGRTVAAMAFADRLASDHGDELHLYPKSEGKRMNLPALLREAGNGQQQVYACGPERLLTELETLSQSWPQNTLHVEYFTATASLLDPANEISFQVELTDSDLTLDVAADQTLLQALHAAGLDVACECEEGLCGSCEVGVVSGDIDHRDRVLSQAERAQSNRMMACCSRVRSGKLVLSL